MLISNSICQKIIIRKKFLERGLVFILRHLVAELQQQYICWLKVVAEQAKAAKTRIIFDNFVLFDSAKRKM